MAKKRVKITLNQAANWLHKKYKKYGMTKRWSKDFSLDTLGEYYEYTLKPMPFSSFKKSTVEYIEDIFKVEKEWPWKND